MKMNRSIFAIIAVVFLIAACATMNVGDVPWAVAVKDWSPKQRATFFMKMWQSQKITYDMMNEMTDKPADLVEVLKVKYRVLEESRKPIRMYSSMVKGGGVPDDNSTDEIIAWLTQLQLQLVYGKGG
jgi:hypothetical protein